jgi:hypothetical protein
MGGCFVVGRQSSVLVPETEREFTSLRAPPEFNLVARERLGMLRAILHTVVSRLTILFAFAVDGVAKLIEKLFGLAWISFSAGLVG